MVKNEAALSKIRALLKSEDIKFTDKVSALKSISETVLPTKLAKVYLKEMERINERI
jgi:hypothetical protein